MKALVPGLELWGMVWGSQEDCELGVQSSDFKP